MCAPLVLLLALAQPCICEDMQCKILGCVPDTSRHADVQGANYVRHESVELDVALGSPLRYLLG